MPVSARSIVVLLLIVGALLTAGCTTPAEPAVQSAPVLDTGSVVLASGSAMLEPEGPVPQIGDIAPDFRYTLTDGTELKLSDLRGSKVILNFWATWCAPCRLEMPALQETSVERANKGVTVLGVNLIEAPEDIVPFGQEMGITFTLIANRHGDIRDRYGALNIPITYFINSDGTIAERHLGVMDKDFIAEQLEKMN